MSSDTTRLYRADLVRRWPTATRSDSFYNATLDEMLFAAKSGMHGLCTNQHHQNVYGFMANPSIMGAVLARQTNGQNIAIIQLGSTLPSTTPRPASPRNTRCSTASAAAPGRRISDRPAGRRCALERRRADRTARALPRSLGAGDDGVGRRRRCLPGTASTISSAW